MVALTSVDKYTNSLRVLQLAQWRFRAVQDAWGIRLPFKSIVEDLTEDGTPTFIARGWERNFTSFQIMAASTLSQCVNEFCAAHFSKNNSRHMGLKTGDYPEREQKLVKHFRCVRDKLTAHVDKGYYNPKLPVVENLLYILWCAFVSDNVQSNDGAEPYPQGVSIGAGSIKNIGDLIELGLSICRDKGAEDVEGQLRMFEPSTLTGCFGILPGEDLHLRGEYLSSKIRYVGGRGMELVGEVGPGVGTEDWLESPNTTRRQL